MPAISTGVQKHGCVVVSSAGLTAAMMQLMEGMLRVPNPLRCTNVTLLSAQVADMDNANIELEDANTQLEASTNAAEQRCAALEQEAQKLHTAQANLKVTAEAFMLCIALPTMHHSLPHTSRLHFILVWCVILLLSNGESAR